ncbi:XrtV sorting system accessory protein [Sphingomonas bacterium]|uniref:XrtV sorting system accessory protein n=1 Tax=Sphingomonas bacterium TaxID=1895847 RepID=UPI0015754D5A|nr:XrtV sorting system accessory protein [Sphingomonas bacterium]
MGVFDLVTLAIFAGLIVLFLQRSIEPGDHRDHLWQYLVASLGCAGANYLGDNDYRLLAVLLIVGTLAFIFYVLKPIPQPPSS